MLWMLPSRVQFTMEGVNKSNSVVDRARLDWINGLHIRHACSESPASRERFQQQCVEYLAVRCERC